MKSATQGAVEIEFAAVQNAPQHEGMTLCAIQTEFSVKVDNFSAHALMALGMGSGQRSHWLRLPVRPVPVQQMRDDIFC